ncbi:MAG: LptF/LptG family permease [Planctomycetota bacterium]|nr:LptF/LptG family permease [Planctomycetota bacterium]
MIFRRHDRYVLRAFASTLFAVITFFSVIIVVLDSAERVRRLTRYWDRIVDSGHHPLAVLAEYYATLLPFVWIRLMPFCVAVAAAFCLARLHRHNELTSLLTCGVSMRRTTWPILGIACLAVSGVFVLQESVVPELSRRHLHLWRMISRSTPERITDVPHFHDRRGGRLSMESYDPFDQTMHAAMVTFYEPASGDLVEQYWYPELQWQGEGQQWIATHGGRRIPADRRAPGRDREPIDAGSAAPLDGSAALLEIALTARMSPGLSLEQIETLERANPQNPGFTVLKHEMYTLPLGVLVLLLLSLPFSFRVAQRSKSAIPGMLASGLLGGLFVGAQFLAASMARAGDWNPIAMTWMPTVLFGSVGLSLFLTMDD